MQTKLLEQYAVLQKEMASLEEQRDLLKTAILEDFKKNNLEKLETTFGSFTVCEKPKWTYSETVSSLEEKVKLTKLKEQKSGKAKKTSTNYLMFKDALSTPKKDN